MPSQLFENQEQALSFKLHKVVFLMEKLSDQALVRELDMTFSQFLVLIAVRRQKLVSQRQIAHFLEKTDASISRQIDLVVEKRWVTKTVNEDNRREFLLSLTPTGQMQLDRAINAIRTMLQPTFQLLDDAQRQHLVEILDVMLGSLMEQYHDQTEKGVTE